MLKRQLIGICGALIFCLPTFAGQWLCGSGSSPVMPAPQQNNNAGQLAAAVGTGLVAVAQPIILPLDQMTFNNVLQLSAQQLALRYTAADLQSLLQRAIATDNALMADNNDTGPLRVARLVLDANEGLAGSALPNGQMPMQFTTNGDMRAMLNAYGVAIPGRHHRYWSAMDGAERRAGPARAVVLPPASNATAAADFQFVPGPSSLAQSIGSMGSGAAASH